MCDILNNIIGPIVLTAIFLAVIALFGIIFIVGGNADAILGKTKYVVVRNITVNNKPYVLFGKVFILRKPYVSVFESFIMDELIVAGVITTTSGDLILPRDSYLTLVSNKVCN